MCCWLSAPDAQPPLSSTVVMIATPRGLSSAALVYLLLGSPSLSSHDFISFHFIFYLCVPYYSPEISP